MSKAFTGESDGEEEISYPEPALPSGTRNYMTPAGAKKLDDERRQIMTESQRLRPGDLDDDRRRKRWERRLEFLTSRLDSAEVIDPAMQPKDQVRFGATVTVQSREGEKDQWRIVGIDESDISRGWISWISPLASALLDKKVGDVATLGSQSLRILKIDYFS